MWLFTKHGFFSCVRSGDDIVIRARSRRHLLALRKRFEDLKEHPIEENAGTDYRYRIRIFPSRFVTLAHELAAEVDYENFKAEVGHKDGLYARALAGVWSLMRRIEV